MTRYRAFTAQFVLTAAFLLPAPAPTFGQQPVASFYYDARGNVTRQEQDTNGDGKMDRWTFYNQQGQVERVEQDLNFDGKADSMVFYQTGRPVRQAVASKNDGQIDTWLVYNSAGEVERRGQDPNRTGQPTVWVFYRNGSPVRSEEAIGASAKANRTVHFQDGQISRVDEDTNGENGKCCM